MKFICLFALKKYRLDIFLTDKTSNGNCTCTTSAKITTNASYLDKAKAEASLPHGGAWIFRIKLITKHNKIKKTPELLRIKVHSKQLATTHCIIKRTANGRP